MARSAQGRADSRRRTAPRRQQRARHADEAGLLPLLAQAVRGVERDVSRGATAQSTRTAFQVVAMLVREERHRIKDDTTLSEGQRNEKVKRLDGIATILATTAAREPSLFTLLADDATLTPAGVRMRREMLTAAGIEVPDEPEPETLEIAPARQVVPQSVISRQLANPFLTPDFSTPAPRREHSGRLANWELIDPLLRSFERGGAAATMALPEPPTQRTKDGLSLMKHQAELIASAADGHRTFLLADEPGLGKTAQALLAAQAADAYPLLVVTPNVVKINWAREAQRWTPRHPATVIQGDGSNVDGFADIVVVNYEVLDRHIGWLGEHGFAGMVVDEAHFIKNRKSQRSQHVLELSQRIRERRRDPLLMALTGTPLINDIDDFRAIWEFLGWTDDRKPLPRLMDALEDTGLVPGEPGFYPAARQAVVDQGIVRRRKIDVAADIPARRIADIPVELDDETGRSLRAAERELARRMMARYDTALETRRAGRTVEGIDHDLVRTVAGWEREEDGNGEAGNVFGMMRRIGLAKAGLAADYTAQLARSVGKVVFFAKHIDVMDVAEETFAKRGMRYATIRGDQTPTQRQRNIDAFVNDPEVSVMVASLTAAGVGVNLQVASNVVLAELSWTDAEQTQAIDRVHRIGQDEPVTAWRIIGAQTIDAKVAELIDSKAELASVALDGAAGDGAKSADVQLEALVALLTDALEERERTGL